ncbi:MAG: hypothetical protein QW039_01865 [Fervidicoccaceae archaeon]
MRTETGLLLAIILAIQLLALPIVTLAAPAVPSEVTFYEFGQSTCPHCTALLNLFAQNFPNNTYFCDIATSQSCLVRFYSWTNFSGFPLSVPQTFVIYNNTYILGIVLGEVENVTFWSNIANSKPSETQFPVYIGDTLWGYINGSSVAQKFIIDTFLYPAHSVTTTQPPSSTTAQTGEGISYRSFLATLASLAVTDAVNICVISIYTLLLITIATRKSKTKAALSGLMFTLGVFFGYILLGLGLLKVISSFGGVPSQIMRYILIAYGFLLLATSIYSQIRKMKCKVCREEEGFLGKLFSVGRWAEKSPALHFIFGLILSIALIPCSAGPYVVFLAMLSSISGVAKLLYLLAYVMIFVAPLFIFLEIVVLTMRAIPQEKVSLVRNIVALIAGILLIIVALGLI